ncbi:hypothetical protein FQN50_004281 [Emmonsiellopsis sp. PD_5]|nr:hypothetical protein FQN50_004281 [Emmonsiellopsis sp. PD_5]
MPPDPSKPPPPPPPPSHKPPTYHPRPSQPQPQPQSPSPFLTSLSTAPPDYLTNLTNAIHGLPPRFPTYYFFYGTLTHPATLQRILDLPHPPSPSELRPAKIIGYRLAKWGDYPALIDGEQGEEVRGMAYLVKDEGQAGKLEAYETSAYRVVPVWIRWVKGEGTDEGDGEEGVSGKSFMYAGDARALVEGRWDRVLWERQMQMRTQTKTETETEMGG